MTVADAGILIWLAKCIGVKTKSVLFIRLKSVKLELPDKDKDKNHTIFRQMLEDGFWLAPTTAVEFENRLFKL